MDGTYAVPEKQFLFLGELLPGDAKKIKAQQAEALKLGLKFKNYLYSR